MYAATLTIDGTTTALTGTVDEVTEWLATNHNGWDIDSILTAMLTVITYGKTLGDTVTSSGRFQVREATA
jgi:hypothetical protein